MLSYKNYYLVIDCFYVHTYLKFLGWLKNRHKFRKTSRSVIQWRTLKSNLFLNFSPTFSTIWFLDYGFYNAVWSYRKSPVFRKRSKFWLSIFFLRLETIQMPQHPHYYLWKFNTELFCIIHETAGFQLVDWGRQWVGGGDNFREQWSHGWTWLGVVGHSGKYWLFSDIKVLALRGEFQLFERYQNNLQGFCTGGLDFVYFRILGRGLTFPL